MDNLSYILTYNDLHFCSIAILYYDHAITFTEEVTAIWKSPLRLSSILFLLNRYLAFTFNLVSTFVELSDVSCRQFNSARESTLVVIQMLVCVIQLLRTYALYGCNRRVLLSLLLVGIILMAVAFWYLSGSPHVPSDSILGCHTIMGEVAAVHNAAVWEALLIWDTLIFGLTVVKTYRASRESRVLQLERSSLATVMFRDGAIYFAVMALANLVNIINYYAAPPLLKNTLSTVASSISVSMMSRLMLNLHKSANIGIMSSTATVNHLGDLVLGLSPADSTTSSPTGAEVDGH